MAMNNVSIYVQILLLLRRHYNIQSRYDDHRLEFLFFIYLLLAVLPRRSTAIVFLRFLTKSWYATKTDLCLRVHIVTSRIQTIIHPRNGQKPAGVRYLDFRIYRESKINIYRGNILQKSANINIPIGETTYGY